MTPRAGGNRPRAPASVANDERDKEDDRDDDDHHHFYHFHGFDQFWKARLISFAVWIALMIIVFVLLWSNAA